MKSKGVVRIEQKGYGSSQDWVVVCIGIELVSIFQSFMQPLFKKYKIKKKEKKIKWFLLVHRGLCAKSQALDIA